MSVIPSSGATGSQEERGTRPATWSAIRLTQAAGECTLRPVVGYWARAGVWAPGAVSWQQCGGGVVEAAGLPCPPRLEDHACTTPLPPAFTFLVIACTIPTLHYFRTVGSFGIRLCSLLGLIADALFDVLLTQPQASDNASTNPGQPHSMSTAPNAILHVLTLIVIHFLALRFKYCRHLLSQTLSGGTS